MLKSKSIQVTFMITIIFCQAYSQVDSFKFTDEEKSTAFVKFMAAEASPEAFLSNMIGQGPPLPFEPTLVVTKPVNPETDGN